MSMGFRVLEEARCGQCGIQTLGGMGVRSNKGRVIVISGPTAVGKSHLALAIAKRLLGEIVSADSVQVYKGLDVGSAKTPLSQRQGVVHHLIDIVHPTEEYTVGAFCDDAWKATKLVIGNGHVPILVGGTGLYMRWYLNGKPGTPKETPEVTALVDAEVSPLQDCGDWDAGTQLLEKAGDPYAAQSIGRNDWYRLRRALSIIKATGVPRTNFPHVGKDTRNKAPAETFHSLAAGSSEIEFLCYFLYKRRVDLYRAIDLRCEEMLSTGNYTESGGFLAEASWMLDLGIKPNSSPPSRAIGYRQAMQYLTECRKAEGKTSEEHFMNFLASIQQASRNYAKKQMSWYRGDAAFSWLDASQPLESIVEFVVDEYHKSRRSSAAESPVLIAPQMIDKDENIAMKTYRPDNKIFIDSSACATITNWIRRTQRHDKAEDCFTKLSHDSYC